MEDDLWKAYNPFQSALSDTNLLTLNSSLRAALFFNRNNPKFSFDVAYQDTRNKSLLVNGFDSRLHQFISGRFRWNITRAWMISAESNTGWKNSSSDYFPTRNYRIQFVDAIPKLSLQIKNSFRIAATYKYVYKYNHEGTVGEKAIIHNAGLEIKVNFLSKGSLLVKGNFIPIRFNAEENNSLAFEMLEGFKKGNNITWNVSYQRNISDNLQLSLLYDGRQSPGNKMIHVGSVQLRAYF
jgi:hypothetical protein